MTSTVRNSKATALHRASTTRATTRIAVTLPTRRQHSISNTVSSSTGMAISTSSKATVSNRASTASLVPQAALQMASAA